jgi:F-type H+-transporting ATPase subunit epsilon
MAKTMRLEILTPDEVVLDTDVEAIRVQLPDGWWGILPGHAPFLAQVVAGILQYRRGEKTRYVALYQGSIEVQHRPGQQDRVLVLTAAAEEGTELSEMENALERQRERMREVAQEAHIEFTRARVALERALREADLGPLGPVEI